MRRTTATFALASALAAGAFLGGGVPATAGAALAVPPHAAIVCPAPRAGEAACLAQRWVSPPTGTAAPLGFHEGPVGTRPVGTRRTLFPAAVQGKTPTDIQSAYKLTGLSAGGRTVAIVDAYGYPNAERDLGIYRAQFGLRACTKANGCLSIVNQSVGSTPPAFDPGWAGEQALDLDAVSAACPSCKILLVQAASERFTDLGTAVDTAARRAGVVAISNSYGGDETPPTSQSEAVDDATLGRFYNHPGIAITASTGDSGFHGPAYPASSQFVTAVGGTSLVKSGSPRGWAESVWRGSGSGCSTLNAAPASQTKLMTGCDLRAMADVAAVADPSTGLAVYAPVTATTSSWAQYGGTSLSAPIVAAVYALSGNTAGYANTLPYARPSSLYDVTSGTNGSCAIFCTAKVGYDGPTGLGTPNGVSAF